MKTEEVYTLTWNDYIIQTGVDKYTLSNLNSTLSKYYLKTEPTIYTDKQINIIRKYSFLPYNDVLKILDILEYLAINKAMKNKLKSTSLKFFKEYYNDGYYAKIKDEYKFMDKKQATVNSINHIKNFEEKYGIRRNIDADNIFYYFSFVYKDNKYYKLGITSQTLQERYGKDYFKINKILYNEKIDSAIRIEKELKQNFKEDIFPLKFFNDGGHTEIFDRDILEIDIE